MHVYYQIYLVYSNCFPCVLNAQNFLIVTLYILAKWPDHLEHNLSLSDFNVFDV